MALQDLTLDDLQPRAAALREREARLRQLQVEIDKISRVSVLGQVSSALAHELHFPRGPSTHCRTRVSESGFSPRRK